jgi:hypothetical protein
MMRTGFRSSKQLNTTSSKSLYGTPTNIKKEILGEESYAGGANDILKSLKVKVR